MNLFQLTRKLIDIPSVSDEEGAVGKFLGAHLEGLGYRVEMQTVEGERQNVIATTGAPPRVVLSTHMDTVPPHIVSSEDGEFIYGRGACDAKGIIAAQVFAAETLRASGMKEIGLLFTVDEEQASLGAKVANDHPMARECAFLINGEPTDNKLAIGTKGSLRVLVATDGRAAHSAYPEEGESAIEKMLDVLADLRALHWPDDKVFGETTCNIGVIAGGTRSNVVPAHASADLQIRLATDKTQIKQMIEEGVAGRATLEYTSEHNPVRLESVAGFEECVVRFTTDIPYLTNWGKALLIGPGSILVAHTSQEKIAKNELAEAIDLYVKLVRQLMNRFAEPAASG
ncbi:MAG: acetylornithine deacetylase [Blastocatellia bacterium]|jgi:acetylornithine deacetylase|nr:acetylornithine deacetylase [Blastocatellia bacterium]